MLTYVPTYEMFGLGVDSSCIFGKLETLQCIILKGDKYEPDDASNGFIIACDEGHFEIAQWMVSVNLNIDISHRNNEAFVMVCVHGNWEIAKWLLTLNPTISDVTLDMEDAFRHACSNGHLEMAQWILTLNPDINVAAKEERPHFHNVDAFYQACVHGHLEVAKWLMSINPDLVEIKDSVHVTFEDMFNMVCFCKHPDMAKWLITIKPDFIDNTFHKYIINNLFQTACRWDEELKIAPFLLTISQNDNVSFEDAFCNACISGNLEIAKWLLVVKPDINVSAKNDRAFHGACFWGHLEVAHWLLSIKPTINVYVCERQFCKTPFTHNTHSSVKSTNQWLRFIKPDIKPVFYSR